MNQFDHAIGDTVTVAIGDRTSEYIASEETRTSSYSLQTMDGEREESLTNVQDETYTIVGVTKKPLWESSWSPGYSMIRILTDNNHDNHNDVAAFMSVPNVDRGVYDELTTFGEEIGLDRPFFNDDLLRASGITASDSMQSVLYGLISIIMAIIVIGSVALIFNSFAISVSERSRYLGMLSSVGATKRQKRNSVYFEGFIIGSIAIPLGMIAGVLGIGVTLSIIGSIMEDMGVETELFMVVSPEAVMISAVIAMLTIFISTYVPAQRASRITAIDAIRQSHDVKLTKRKVKTNRFVRSLFGVEGEIALKNQKRNKKRYMVTVFSLVVSIVLFLSVSYFGSAFTKSLELSNAQQNFDISVQLDADENEEANLVQELTSLDAVERFSMNRSQMFRTVVEEERLPEALVDDMNNHAPELKEEGGYSYYVRVFGLSDSSFSEYAQQIGVEDASFRNTDDPQAILINHVQYEDDEAGKFVETESIQADVGDQFDIEIEVYPEGADEWTYEDVGSIEIGALTSEHPIGYIEQWLGSMTLIVSTDVFETLTEQATHPSDYRLYLQSDDPELVQEQIDQMDQVSDSAVMNMHEAQQRDQQMVMIISIFLYGFITLITLISIANILNTISTSIALRKREFAMLKSMGMTPKSFNKMIYFESIFYGIKALAYGLPISGIIMYGIYFTNQNAFSYAFELPWTEIIAVIIGVFIIVAMAMAYSMSKVKKNNIIETLKQENL
ncbi:ABC transporter ATP-binding protein [Geomicrobium sp. JCM 19055]|nr:ABC transporter ATP-binding protein [Geomicrobium sp. JCM 19055]